jgi:formylglycine-generating enzyme required for sulfatase activity
MIIERFAGERAGYTAPVTTSSTLAIDTVLVPAGAFIMGDSGGRPDERPAHEVLVDAFRIARAPITNAEYGRFLAESGREAPPFMGDAKFNAADQPVVGVTWDDAAAFCAWLSALTGGRWRLPTEAEREKAARGGLAGAEYPCGGDGTLDGGGIAQDAPRAVGLSAPNGYGLYDMAYNVHEWCSDWYDAAYYAVSPAENPQGPATGRRRSARGGAWRHQVKTNRCAARSSLDPSFRYNDFGFRVVTDAG